MGLSDRCFGDRDCCYRPRDLFPWVGVECGYTLVGRNERCIPGWSCQFCLQCLRMPKACPWTLTLFLDISRLRRQVAQQYTWWWRGKDVYEYIHTKPLSYRNIFTQQCPVAETIEWPFSAKKGPGAYLGHGTQPGLEGLSIYVVGNIAPDMADISRFFWYKQTAE